MKIINDLREQAVGVRSDDKGGILLTTKREKNGNQPAVLANEVALTGNTSGPK